jgi:hypothetical protein
MLSKWPRSSNCKLFHSNSLILNMWHIKSLWTRSKPSNYVTHPMPWKNPQVTKIQISVCPNIWTPIIVVFVIRVYTTTRPSKFQFRKEISSLELDWSAASSFQFWKLLNSLKLDFISSLKNSVLEINSLKEWISTASNFQFCTLI